MKKLHTATLSVLSAGILLTSCSTYQRTMTDSNSRVNFTTQDFAITPAFGGFAKETRILGIDWARLFKTREGEITGSRGSVTGFSIPIIGSVTSATTVDNYALYDLMKAHPNFDAVFYPQFKRKRFAIPFLYSHTTVEVKARLGKLQAGSGEGDNSGDDGK